VVHISSEPLSSPSAINPSQSERLPYRQNPINSLASLDGLLQAAPELAPTSPTTASSGRSHTHRAITQMPSYLLRQVQYGRSSGFKLWALAT